VSTGAACFVVRVWLPDRTGVLGAVASRIGAVRGDVVGIDILERDGGRAVDELVVELPDAALVELLVAEVEQVDGVAVEDIRPVRDSHHDPRVDVLETAALLVAAVDRDEVVQRLCDHSRRTLGADWAAVVDLDDGLVHASVGPAPMAAWLTAFIAGSRSSAPVASLETGPDDVLWAPLPDAHLAVVMGRHATPFRARERRQAAALARIVDSRFCELSRRQARRCHPASMPAQSTAARVTPACVASATPQPSAGQIGQK
jgi:hypothetical protein